MPTDGHPVTDIAAEILDLAGWVPGTPPHGTSRIAATTVRTTRASVFTAAALEAAGFTVQLELDDTVRVLDFDHRPGAGKRKDVMTMVKEGFSIPKLLEEIEKCDVRCRNCHAIVTLERGGANWRSLAMTVDSSSP